MNKGMTLGEYQAQIAGTRERLRLTKIALLEYIRQVDEADAKLDIVEADLMESLRENPKGKAPAEMHEKVTALTRDLDDQEEIHIASAMSRHPAGKRRRDG